jgi:hypothetical protein
MPGVEFEPTIPVFQRWKTFHTLDSAATVIGFFAPKDPEIRLPRSTKKHVLGSGETPYIRDNTVNV